METFSSSSWTWGASYRTGGEYGGDDDADDESTDAETRTSSKDSLIFVVDCSESMFVEREAGECPYSLSLRCAKNVLSNKIISSDRDLMGIVFYGTAKEKNSSDFKNVFVLHDLDSPDAKRILELEELSAEGDCHEKFKAKFGHSSVFSLYDVLWTCGTMFANSSQKIGHKRVMIFTDNDNPHTGNLALVRQAEAKAKDLFENGVEIELLHLNPPQGTFDSKTFYQDIVMVAEDEDTGTLPDPSDKFEELLTRVRSKDHKKRSLMNIPFILGPGLELGIRVYALARSTKKGVAVKLDARSNEEVKPRTKNICEDTGTMLMPTDIKRSYVYGGDKIIFEKHEVDSMKQLVEPGLKLLGFKPKSFVKRFYQVKPSNFIYPDETVIKGSGKLFATLLKRALSRDVVAICVFTPRTVSLPRFVALIPEAEQVDDRRVQISPPGFHLVYLPFADELRKLAYPQMEKANEEQIDKALEVVKKLKFKFSSESFENPALQQHYSNLEALALERDAPDEIVDLTEPDVDLMEKRAGRIMKEFADAVYPNGYDAIPAVASRKRAGPSGGGGAAAKRATLSQADADVIIATVREHAQNGTMSKLTVATLKEYLKAMGKKSSGKKSDLIDMAKEHLGM